MDKPAPDALKAIRDRIDAIDEAVHRLLIERSGVIREHRRGLRFISTQEENRAKRRKAERRRRRTAS